MQDFSGLTLNLLGDFQAYLDGELVAHFRTRKMQAALALLAVERGRAVRREQLMTLLWPGMPERSARKNLNQVLYLLRQRFPELPAQNSETTVPLLLGDDHNVQLNPEARVSVDVWRLDDLVRQAAAHSCASQADCPECREALLAAVELYRGDFLADFYLADSSDFEAWAEAQRQTSRGQILDALDGLAEIHLQQGEYDCAQTIAERQLGIDPLRESAHRQLMEAFVRNGHRTRALRQYRLCTQVLADELGASPSQETTMLYERIRAERVQPVKAGKPAPRPPQARPLPAAAGVEKPAPFYGRLHELERLNATLARSQAGQAQVVFVTGDPGRGKTALMAAFARQALGADPTLLVAQGHCNAFSGTSDPYRPFQEILHQLSGDMAGQHSLPPLSELQARRLWASAPATLQRLADHGPYLVERLIPGEALLERAQALGQDGNGWLKGFQDFIERSRRLSGYLPQSALFEQFSNLLRSLAREQPVLLLLDDLQWADQGSLHLLAHLGQRLGEVPVCLVCAYRSEEVVLQQDGKRHPLLPVLHELERRLGEISIDLLEARREARRSLMDAFLDAEPNQLGGSFRERFYERTQGHPLFTVELLRALQEQGGLVRDPELGWMEGEGLNLDGMPARVEAVIAERVDRLDPDLRGILGAASVEREYFTAQLIAQVEGLSERQILQGLHHELEGQHQLVREVGEVQVEGRYLTRYRFGHALIQAYLYNGLGAGERRLLHGEVGTALEELYAGHTDQVLAALAHHYEEAGWVEQAVRYLHKAGQAAAAGYAYQEAVDYFSRGLELAPVEDAATRFALLEEREKVLDLLGLREAQNANIEQMAALAERLGAGSQAWVALRKAKYFGTGDFSQAVEHIQAALALAQQAEKQALAAQVYVLWGWLVRDQGENTTALAKFQNGLDLAKMADDKQQMADCLGGLGGVAFIQGNYAVAIDFFEQALAIQREIGNHQGTAGILEQLGHLVQAGGDLVSAKSYFEQALLINQEIGHLGGEADNHKALGLVDWYLGEYVAGKTHLEQSLSIFRENGDRLSEGWNFIGMGLLAFYQGDDETAKCYDEQALKILREIGNRRGEGTSLRQLSLVVWRQGDEALGKANLERSLIIFQETGDRYGEENSLNELGAIALAQGDLPRAESCYQRALIIRQELNQPQNYFEDKAGLARVKLDLGDLQSAREYGIQILNYYRANPCLYGAEHTMRTFRFTWEVWTGLGEAAKADEVLSLAAAVIQDYLDKYQDPEVQTMYLRQPHHAVLWAAWMEKMAG